MNEDKEPIWYRQEGESDSAYNYFDVYRNLPFSKRSVSQVAKLTNNKSNNRLFQYAKDFNWDERARAWDNYVIAKQDEFIIKQREEVKLEYIQEARSIRKAILVPIRSFAKKINAGENFDAKSLTELYKMVIQTPDKFKKLQEIEFTALGEASDIKKEDITSNGNTIKITFEDI